MVRSPRALLASSGLLAALLWMTGCGESPTSLAPRRRVSPSSVTREPAAEPLVSPRTLEIPSNIQPQSLDALAQASRLASAAKPTPGKTPGNSPVGPPSPAPPKSEPAAEQVTRLPPVVENIGPITDAEARRFREERHDFSDSAPEAFASAPPLDQQLPASGGSTPNRQASGDRPSSAPPDAMRPVLQRAREINERAARLARRGALTAARNEFLRSLRMIAQSRDALEGGGRRTQSLAAAMAALQEVRDFRPRDAEFDSDLNVARIAATHRTAALVFATEDAGQITPLAASQRYFTFAQAQLAIAGGREPVAAQTLFYLGKVFANLADETSESQQHSLACAMVCYQAALNVDDGNHLAANELGVLLARLGRWRQAQQLFLRGVAVNRKYADGWYNLTIAHQHLKENDLAQRARHEYELLGGPAKPSKFGDPVQWVDASTFAAAHTPGEAPPPRANPSETAAKSTGKARR